VALQGGKIFSKLDFLNAYNQLELWEITHKLLAWSKSKSIYIIKNYLSVPNQLVESFSFIKKVLLKTKGAKNFLDDIIVTGSSKKEHLDNLSD